MQRIYLSGIAGVADHYKIIRYSCVDSEGMTIMALKYEAARLRMDYPNIGHVYAVDASSSLYRSYMEAIKKGSMEICISFRYMLLRQGVEVILAHMRKGKDLV